MRFFLVTVADVRAHPIGSAGPSSSNDVITSSSTVSGTTPAPCSSLAAYIIIDLSYRVSCSRANLCVSQSRCFSNEEHCWKDLKHPSCGQWNSQILFSLFSSSLSFSIVEANSVVCLGRCLALTVSKETLELALSASLFKRGRGLLLAWRKLLQGKNLPQPIPYALHTCIPLLLYSMLLMKLTPSHFDGADFAVGCGHSVSR